MALYLLILLLFPVQTLKTDVVTVHVRDVTIKTGKIGIVTIQVDVKEGYHIQANQTKDEFLIPTTIVVENSKNIKAGKAVFPESKKFRLEGTNDFMDVFDSSFQIKIPVRTTGQVEKGSYTLQAELRYQACDARTCLFPKTISFTIHYQIK